MTSNASTSVKDMEEPAALNPNVKRHKTKLIWKMIIIFLYIHLSAIYGLYLAIFEAKWQTIIWTFLTYELTAIAVVAGNHRLYSHKTYKVKRPLEVFLVFLSSMAAQKSVFNWARDHRIHHKYTDTEIDPHNSRRGFFFSHVGWLIVKKNPETIRAGKTIFLDDLYANPILMFQHKYYYSLAIFSCAIFPTLVPMYFWNETFMNSWHTMALRHCFTLHMTWLVNSAAHMFGTRDYDKSILPTENFLVSIGLVGAGWHNYHHSFPWDYRAAELGGYCMNVAALFIDLMAMIGQAYDLKTASPSVIEARKKRTGCLSDEAANLDQQKIHSWGWGDAVPYEEQGEPVS